MSKQLLRITEVETIIGFKKTFIYKEITEGRFPAPLKVGRSSRWKEVDITKWMDNLSCTNSGNQSEAESQGVAA